jgi:hypothetical protein
MRDWLPAIFGLAAFAALLLWFHLRRFDFHVTAQRGRIRFRGRFPPGHRQHVADFLSSAPGKVKVAGGWGRSGRLHLTISAASPGERQRIRNYFMATMRP